MARALKREAAASLHAVKPIPEVKVKANSSEPREAKTPSVKGVQPEMKAQIPRIVHSGRTAFEKRVWTALCQIPRGEVTTYGLLSNYLGSSPRAVGNALRRNPFAPEVPCHRVVATSGKLGGFKGAWPKNGEGITITEKRKLLKSEGVVVQDDGKVVASMWQGFV